MWPSRWLIGNFSINNSIPLGWWSPKPYQRNWQSSIKSLMIWKTLRWTLRMKTKLYSCRVLYLDLLVSSMIPWFMARKVLSSSKKSKQHWELSPRTWDLKWERCRYRKPGKLKGWWQVEVYMVQFSQDQPPKEGLSWVNGQW